MENKIIKHTERYKIILEQVHIGRKEEPGVFVVSNGRYDASYAYFLRQKSDKLLPEDLEKVVSCAINKVMRDGMPNIGHFDFPNKVALEITLNLNYGGIGYMGKLRKRDYKRKKNLPNSRKSQKPAKDNQSDNPGFDFNEWYKTNQSIYGDYDRFVERESNRCEGSCRHQHD
ncbi:hypothetical protein HZA33_01865 [Candidatus Pacearchaeota archaeon]|nr:hypothetical protein [Candidatus Pacearchaeota archaeon]